MKIVLRTDVSGVGRRGDIVEVSGGFARNYLLPRGAAMVATDGIEAQAQGMRRARDLREAHDRGAAEAKAQTLAGAVLRIEARAGSAGRLFGSVTTNDIADAAKDGKGVEVARHQIGLAEPIKEVGTYEVPIELFPDVSTVVTVEVVAAS